jgi:gentisate 1,2-dioxygenase
MAVSAVKVSEDKKAAYYDQLGKLKLIPFWEVRQRLVAFEPGTPCKTHLWRFADVKSSIELLASYIDVKGAERRSLVLENPGLPGTSQATKSLYASLQYVGPGEIEDSHRHVASAFRFVLQGTGAHTTVAGEKFYLSPGDVVLTPNMTWHEHGNETSGPMIMFDALDIPLVNHFGASFKGLIDGPHEITKPVGDGLARYGSGVLQVDSRPSNSHLVSPMCHYPYERARSALEHMKKSDRPDACHGFKVRYTNPITGDHAFPTIGLFLQLLPRGFNGNQYRATDESIFVVAEGSGRTVVGEHEINWSPNDVFVVPSWVRHQHFAQSDAVLFSCSDRPAQEKLGFWREQQGENPVSFS